MNKAAKARNSVKTDGSDQPIDWPSTESESDYLERMSREEQERYDQQEANW